MKIEVLHNNSRRTYRNNFSIPVRFLLLFEEIAVDPCLEENEKKALEKERETSKNPSPKKDGVKKEKPLKFTYKEEKEFQEIDEVIAVIEGEIEALDGEIEKNSSDFQRLQELLEEKGEKEKLLEEKYERWEYLNDLHEKIEASKN